MAHRSGLPKHCSWNWDRHGKKRVRFRLRGFSTYITGVPYSDDFMRQYHAALDGVRQSKEDGAGVGRTKPGSINALIVSYYRSSEFQGLKASTRSIRRNIIERFRVQHGDKPLSMLGRQHVKAIIGAKSSTPESANNLLKVLKVMFAYAVDVEILATNPAAGIKKYKKNNSEGYHSWTEDEIAAFETRHALGTKARLAFALLLYTAQRRSDVSGMGWQHVQGELDLIAVRQEKTGTPLLIPIHPELAAALKAVPKSNLTFLLTEFGAPFTHSGFGNWFRDRCLEAGLRNCSAHGLRKAAARRLAEAGCSANQIAAITGHKTLSEVSHYTKAADQVRLARQGMASLSTEQAQNLVQPSTRLDKNGG